MTEQPRPRVAAIDILRGIVMVIMSIDHASEEFNGGRFFSDSVRFFKAGTELPTGQFLTRWITHLCAPTFVALAGTALAMSTESRRARGATEKEIDRHILVRGALIIAFEFVWMSFAMRGPGKFLGQVLYAIGASLMCMAFLRRLGDRTLLALGLVLALGVELVIGLFMAAHALESLPVGFLVSGGFFFQGRLIVAYPLLPWLAMMCLGWVLGRRLVAWRREGKDEVATASRVLAITGAAALGFFVVVRGLNSYGNMQLLRESADVLQWLHVSKYPPSATYDALELGIAALLLSGLMRLGPRPALEPFRVLGQTALFYYLLHIHLMKLVAVVFGIEGKFGMGAAYVGGVTIALVLYPLCLFYRRFKAAHPSSLARFV